MRYRSIILFLAVCAPCFFVSCDKDDEEPPYDVVVDFEDITFSGDAKYNNNAGETGAFIQGIASFQNYYGVDEWGYSFWYGFAMSQMNDMEAPGYENQYSVYALDNPAGNKFAVGFISTFNSDTIEIMFSQPIKDLSFDVANSTFAALAMKNGNAFAKKFTDADRFELSILAISSGGTETGTIKLGDGTKITNVWNPVRFTSEGITKLKFTLSTTDVGKSGANTPFYFCLDNLKARYYVSKK